MTSIQNAVPTMITAVVLAASAACGQRAAPVTPAQSSTAVGPVVASTAPELATRSFLLPAAPGPGEPREVAMLVDVAGLKVATIVLRQGTLLPSHQSAHAVTIVALQGAGNVTAGSATLRIDATHAVLLAPNVAHAVQPDAGTDLVLLVHHVGAGERSDQ